MVQALWWGVLGFSFVGGVSIALLQMNTFEYRISHCNSFNVIGVGVTAVFCGVCFASSLSAVYCTIFSGSFSSVFPSFDLLAQQTEIEKRI